MTLVVTRECLVSGSGVSCVGARRRVLFYTTSAASPVVRSAQQLLLYAAARVLEVAVREVVRDARRVLGRDVAACLPDIAFS